MSFFVSNTFLVISSLALIIISLYREWEEGRFKEFWDKIYNERKLENDKIFSIRCIDIFLYYMIQRSLNYIFRGFFIRQILNPYIIIPFLIILSLNLMPKVLEEKIGSTDFILLITFIAILWYSKETYALRESQKK